MFLAMHHLLLEKQEKYMERGATLRRPIGILSIFIGLMITLSSHLSSMCFHRMHHKTFYFLSLQGAKGEINSISITFGVKPILNATWISYVHPRTSPLWPNTTISGNIFRKRTILPSCINVYPLLPIFVTCHPVGRVLLTK